MDRHRSSGIICHHQPSSAIISDQFVSSINRWLLSDWWSVMIHKLQQAEYVMKRNNKIGAQFGGRSHLLRISWKVSSTIASKGFAIQPSQPWWYVAFHDLRNFTWMFSAANVDTTVLAICIEGMLYPLFPGGVFKLQVLCEMLYGVMRCFIRHRH